MLSLAGYAASGVPQEYHDCLPTSEHLIAAVDNIVRDLRWSDEVLARELFFRSVEHLLDARDGTIFLETDHLSRIGVLFGKCGGIKALLLAYVADPRALDDDRSELPLLDEQDTDREEAA
ncbi:MAG: hypothetical protein ABI779_09280 [Acidobacteriota bacterium]